MGKCAHFVVGTRLAEWQGMACRRRRNSLRLRDFDYSRVGVYSITICTHGRVPLLGEVIDGVMHLSEAGRVVKTVWEDLPNHYPYIELDEFQIMPEHVHPILAIVRPRVDADETRRRMLVPLIMGRLKAVSAKGINDLRGTPGVRIWQRGYHDQIVYNEKHLARARTYVALNPRRYRGKP
jgi:REP element-mobilizing transposase RayT